MEKNRLFYLVILIFLSQYSIGQVYEEIYPGSTVNPVELNDSSLLCLYNDSICNISTSDGTINWIKPIYGSLGKIIKGDNNTFYCLGTTLPVVLPTNISRVLVVKVNENGDTLWSRTFGVTTNYPIGNYSNGNLYFGYYNGNQNSFLYRIDENGNLLDSLIRGTDIVRSIEVANDYSYIAYNNLNNYSINILKLDSSLIVVDTLIYSNSTSHISDFKLKDSTFIITASHRFLVINRFTDQIIIDTTFINISLSALTIYDDSIVALTGSIKNNFDYDVSVSLFDTKNNYILASKRLGSKDKSDKGYKIMRVYDGDLIISGRTGFLNHNPYDGYIIKLDSNLSNNPCSIYPRIYDNLRNTCVGSKVYIHNNSFGINKSFTWIIENDTFYNKDEINYFIYNADSVDLVNIRMISCNDTISTSFLVIDTLIPLFTYTYIGDSIEFKASSGSNMTSYRWDFGDGAYILDSVARHQYNSSGTYMVSLSMNNGDCYIQQNDSLSISVSIQDVVSKEDYIEVYPNPNASGVFKIRAFKPYKDIEVFSAIGEQIPFDLTDNELILKNIKSGVYIIKITNVNDETSIKKVIISK